MKEIKKYFESKGLECEEIQANDPSVGISVGYVAFYTPQDYHYIISYDDALWWTEKKGSIYDILKDSKLDKEYYS